MEETQVVTYSKNELLDIFATEEDKKGTDLLKMSNYFDIFVSKIDTRIDSKELIKYWLLESLLQRNLL
ncbi:hypothetical protein ACTQ1L_07155 [Agathobacter sp. LCP21S3_B2]|uniref:hypothetical protein n=1 Tax=Agathobacter sp. LCP21S3_B2 TaxID=3438734 RepID=UPI003F91F615